MWSKTLESGKYKIEISRSSYHYCIGTARFCISAILLSANSFTMIKERFLHISCFLGIWDVNGR